MKVFNFSFLVQRYKSVKKVFKPAGVSRKFLSLLDRQELLQDFYSINQDFNTPRSALVERNLPFRKFTYSEIDSDSVRESEEISDRPRANLCICRWWDFIKILKVGGIKIARNWVSCEVNDLFKEDSFGDRVSSLTISEGTDWTVGSGLCKGLNKAGFCGDGLSSVWTLDETKGTKALSLTSSRTSGGRKIGESKMVGHGLHETAREVLFNGGKSSTESRSMIDCSLVAIKGTKWFGSQALW